MARELHDDIGQKLALLQMDVERLQQRPPSGPEETRSRLAELRDRTAAISEDLRKLSHRLHPSILDDLGLPTALRQLVEEFGAAENMPVSFRHQGLPDKLAPEVAGALYRIAQEALRNIAKHAGKTHVRVNLAASNGRLRLTIRDVGEGFDASEATPSGWVC